MSPDDTGADDTGADDAGAYDGIDAGGVRDDPAALAAAVLAEEERRQAAPSDDVTVLEDAALPGLGEASVSWRTAIGAGGPGLLAVLALLHVADEFPRVALAVLGPDIQETFGISDSALAAVAALGGVVLVLSTLPAAWLGDRIRRTRVISAGAALSTAFIALIGAVQNAFQMALAIAGNGFGQATHLPNSQSLLADAYPIQSRARVFAIVSTGRPFGQVIGPFIVGAIATAAGGVEGWRWAFFAAAIPTALLALAALALRDPQRGRYEQEAVLGGVIADDAERPPPVSLSAAFQRLKKVRTFYFLVVGIGTLGFALVAVPLLFGLMLEDDYGYGAYTRGWMISIAWLGALVSIPVAGVLGDRLFARDPTRVLRLAGALIAGYGLFVVVALRFDAPVALIGFYMLANACQGAALLTISPVVAAVVPFTMRSQAFALVGVYIFLMGGFFGGLIAGAMSDAWGERTALTVLVPPATLIGAALVLHGSRFMKRDMSLVVAELQEEKAERDRIAADPGSLPVLQVRDLDFSYGPVQVLFGCSLEVRPGEVLALLGTNGAGKSTLLRAVAGLGIPDRGVIRFNGRAITYTPAEYRHGQGIVVVRGGRVFPDLTVRENLELFALKSVRDRSAFEARVADVYGVFPALGERVGQRASELSGGQRQMLALALALVHQPKLLIIDELSLGLAPIVVQELVEVVRRLRAEGMTMIIVEQSLTVALALADRAVFMEKGHVRFDGPAEELARRDDLARAVFLGGEGG